MRRAFLHLLVLASAAAIAACDPAGPGRVLAVDLTVSPALESGAGMPGPPHVWMGTEPEGGLVVFGDYVLPCGNAEVAARASLGDDGRISLFIGYEPPAACATTAPRVSVRARMAEPRGLTGVVVYYDVWDSTAFGGLAPGQTEVARFDVYRGLGAGPGH